MTKINLIRRKSLISESNRHKTNCNVNQNTVFFVTLYMKDNY